MFLDPLMPPRSVVLGLLPKRTMLTSEGARRESVKNQLTFSLLMLFVDI